MKKTMLASVVALAAVSSAVFASNAYAQDAFDWTGLYAGVDVGFGSGDTDWSNIVVPSDTGQNYAPVFSSSSFSGVVGSAHVGYNSRFGQWIAGVEGGITVGDLTGTDVCFGNPSYGDYYADCETKVKWIADFAARIGGSPVDRTFVYVKGGLSIANADFTAKNEMREGGGGTPTGGYGTTNDTRAGYLLGVGAEYAVNRNWTLGLEYNYRDFGTKNTSFTPAPPVDWPNPPFSADTTLKVSTFVARVSYKF